MRHSPKQQQPTGTPSEATLPPAPRPRVVVSLQAPEELAAWELMEQYLDLALSTRASEAKRLRDELGAWLVQADVDQATGYDIALATVEAFTNALRHPVERGSETIRVHGCIDSHAVTLTIDDHGNWRKPDRTRGSGGYGLALMKALMTDMQIERTLHGTRVSLRRQLQ
jgi:anti-sigma regulatory factor (Ser/Thr protein kinase)